MPSESPPYRTIHVRLGGVQGPLLAQFEMRPTIDALSHIVAALELPKSKGALQARPAAVTSVTGSRGRTRPAPPIPSGVSLDVRGGQPLGARATEAVDPAAGRAVFSEARRRRVRARMRAVLRFAALMLRGQGGSTEGTGSGTGHGGAMSGRLNGEHEAGQWETLVVPARCDTSSLAPRAGETAVSRACMDHGGRCPVVVLFGAGLEGLAVQWIEFE